MLHRTHTCTYVHNAIFSVLHLLLVACGRCWREFWSHTTTNQIMPYFWVPYLIQGMHHTNTMVSFLKISLRNYFCLYVCLNGRQKLYIPCGRFWREFWSHTTTNQIMPYFWVPYLIQGMHHTITMATFLQISLRNYRLKVV